MENKVVKCLTTNTCNMHSAIHIRTHSLIQLTRERAFRESEQRRWERKKTLQKNLCTVKFKTHCSIYFVKWISCPISSKFIYVLFEGRHELSTRTKQKKTNENFKKWKSGLNGMNANREKKLTYTLHRDTHTQCESGKATSDKARANEKEAW